MAIDVDLGKSVHRVCAAGACIATGAIATFTGDTTSAAGVAAGMLASVGASVLAADVWGYFTRRIGRSGEVFRNHDLTRAVGRAIALVIEQTADDPRCQDARNDVKALARKAPGHWDTLAPLTATNETIAPLAEAELVHLVAARADELGKLTALETQTWADVVEWMADLEKITLRSRTVVVLADRLHQLFPSALREVLKHDLATDGRAYARLEMLVWGELVGALAELKQQSHALRLDLQVALESLLAQVRTDIGQLRADAQGDRRAVLERMDDLVESLRGDLRDGQGQILAALETLLERLPAPAGAGPASPGAGAQAGTGVVPSAALPPQRNALFLPRRTREGKDLIEALHSKPRTIRRVVLHGMAAVGKTQAALEYAHRYSEERHDYSDVFWTVAETEDQLRAGALGIAVRLGLATNRPVDQLLNDVKAALEARDGWLWVVDNVVDARMVARHLPGPRKGRVLITTTLPLADLHALGATPIELTHFDDHHEGARFLLTLAGLLERGKSLEAAHPDDSAAARELSEEVGGLPLALDQAAAYIEAASESVREYLDRYRTRGETLRQVRAPGAGQDRDHASVALTFGLIFERLEHDHPATADLLRLLAFLAPDAIPEEILTTGAHLLGDRLEAAIAADLPGTRMPALHARLLARDPRTATLDMHRLVQDVLRDRMAKAERVLWAERAVRAVNAAVPELENMDLDTIDRMLPQFRACVQHIDEFGFEFIEAGEILGKAGGQLIDLARYDEALDCLDRALTIAEAARGPDHLDTAWILDRKATVLQRRADLFSAESLFRRVLAIWEKDPGPDHPHTAANLNNLALLLQDQGKLTEAEPLLRRALAIYEKVLGPDHPHTATSLNNVGRLLQDQGKLTEAEPLLRRALAIREKVLGLDHPHTSTSLNSLGCLLQEQEKLTDAESVFRRALAIYEKILGPDHPDTAASLNNLGHLLQDQGKPTEAEPLLRRALAISEKVLGPDHPDTATSLLGLASLLQDQGNLTDAEPLLRRAWEIRERSLGPDHARTGSALLDYLVVLLEQGRDAEVRSVIETLDPKRARAIRAKLEQKGYGKRPQETDDLGSPDALDAPGPAAGLPPPGQAT